MLCIMHLEGGHYIGLVALPVPLGVAFNLLVCFWVVILSLSPS